MSRVYDALKSAQEQCVPSAPLEREQTASQAAVAEVLQAASAARRNREILAGVRPDAPATTRQLEFEQVQQRCTKPGWKPKPQWNVFATGRGAERQAEQFRTLRAHLYSLRESRSVRTLLLTSTTVGEGKTFVAVNLAQCIARQRGRRVLLIDADLRASKLHIALGAPSAPGLSDYLAGEAQESSIIQTDEQQDLFFIPAGKPCSSPAELLANKQVQTLFSRLVPLFEWVIVDAPPALVVSDASVLAGMCDGVIFVVRAGVAAYARAQAACAELRNRNLLGVVLNGAKDEENYSAYAY